jgi:hypothetical protein
VTLDDATLDRIDEIGVPGTDLCLPDGRGGHQRSPTPPDGDACRGGIRYLSWSVAVAPIAIRRPAVSCGDGEGLSGSAQLGAEAPGPAGFAPASAGRTRDLTRFRQCMAREWDTPGRRAQ